MKLLLDQGLPRTAATELATLGWDVVHVGEVGMAAASDEEILRRALAEQRTVVTLDADFHATLALENASAPSVIRVRIEGLRGVELAALVTMAPAMLEQGKGVSEPMTRTSATKDTGRARPFNALAPLELERCSPKP